jgi:hypothetical protein
VGVGVGVGVGEGLGDGEEAGSSALKVFPSQLFMTATGATITTTKVPRSKAYSTIVAPVVFSSISRNEDALSPSRNFLVSIPRPSQQGAAKCWTTEAGLRDGRPTPGAPTRR